jgi:polysaccharide biosynthesis/export protein
LLKDPRRDLKATADLDYALVVREINPRHDIEVIQFNLGQAISVPGDSDDLLLQPRDQLLVFSKNATDSFSQTTKETQIKQSRQQQDDDARYSQVAQAQRQALGGARTDESVDIQTGAEVSNKQLADKGKLNLQQTGKQSSTETIAQDSRDALLAPVVEKLKSQASNKNPVQLAEVRGEVKFPGVYPLARYATLADLVVAAGGFKESAYAAELSRINEAADASLTISHQQIDLHSLAARSTAPRAQSKDNLSILANPDWRDEVTVQLFGEAKFPGTYRVQRGETIASLIQRAGGLTEFANAKGAVFARESLRKQEAERLVFMKEQLQQEISTMSLRRQAGNAASRSASPTEASALVEKLQSTQAIGRMSINLPAILSGQKLSDVMLSDGDKLYIPTFQNVVSVTGQVQMPSSHVYDPALSVQDYLDKAGGTKKQADTDRIYVIKADGSVMLPGSSYWFSRRENAIEPGDTIIAPIDTDYLDSLSTWSTATQMMYQLGVAWSAIK